MNWPTLLPLSVGVALMVFMLIRIERNWRWAAIGLNLLVLYGIYNWLAFTGQWAEAWLSVGLGLGLVGVWWLVRGRKLPPPVNTIKVWGQDAAPKPKPAELQAEVNQLREDKARLEEELQRLKGKQNGSSNQHD